MLLSLDNLPYWILLGVGLLFFLIILASGMVEGDGNIETGADLDAEAGDGDDLETGGNLALALLGWFGIGKAPLLLLLAFDLSVWGLLGWMLNVWVGTLFGNMPTGFLSAGVLIGSLVASSSVLQNKATYEGAIQEFRPIVLVSLNLNLLFLIFMEESMGFHHQCGLISDRPR